MKGNECKRRERRKEKRWEKNTNEYYFLRMLSTFYFFPVILNFLRRFFYSCFFAFLLVTTRKHHATVKQENRYMKPESTETHFGYLFHFVWIFFFHPHQSMLIEVKLSSKSLAFFAQWPFFSLSSNIFVVQEFLYIFK